jgi:hypothetical protein
MRPDDQVENHLTYEPVENLPVPLTDFFDGWLNAPGLAAWSGFDTRLLLHLVSREAACSLAGWPLFRASVWGCLGLVLPRPVCVFTGVGG